MFLTRIPGIHTRHLSLYALLLLPLRHLLGDSLPAPLHQYLSINYSMLSKYGEVHYNEQPRTCVLKPSFYENTNRFTIHIRLLDVGAMSPQGDQVGLDLGSLNFDPLPFSVPLVRTCLRIGTLIAHRERLFRKLVLCLVLDF